MRQLCKCRLDTLEVLGVLGELGSLGVHHGGGCLGNEALVCQLFIDTLDLIGQLLLLTASICRECDIDGEKALYDACEKMIDEKREEEKTGK